MNVRRNSDRQQSKESKTNNQQQRARVAEMTSSTSRWKTRPVYTRVAITGLLLIALASFVFIVLTLIDGEPSTLVFFRHFHSALGDLFCLMWRFGRWALVLAALWGIANLWWLSAFPNPKSFFDFTLPLLLSAGGLLALGGGRRRICPAAPLRRTNGVHAR
jgi:hypothetical protein